MADAEPTIAQTVPVPVTVPEPPPTTEPPTTTTTEAPVTTQAPTTVKPKPVPTTAKPVPVTTAAPVVEEIPAEEAPEPEIGVSGACGGDLPPCYVMMRESGGNITAQNPTSTASGKWQFLDSTWQGYGGYAKARYAPESVQDAKARQLWAGGRGCSHWSACS